MFSSPWPLDPGESMTFSVHVQEGGSAALGKTVTFSVSPDDGTVSLSTTSATTDSNGQAQTILENWERFLRRIHGHSVGRYNIWE